VKERLLKFLNKYGRAIGYPVFYVVSLLVCASFTFPYDKLRERVVATFNAQQRATGGQQELQIDEMSGYWLSGVRVKGVRLLTAPKEAGQPPERIEIDEATVRYAILPMLIGHSDIGFDVYAFGGEASGSYEVHGKDKSIDVNLDSIDLGKVDALVALLGVPLQGKLAGAIHLSMPEGKASKGSGTVSLEATEVSVGDGKAKIKGMLALPRVDVGTLTIGADAKDGILKITKLVAGGRDLELQGDGRVNMRELATDSICDAQVRFKINDAYRNKSELAKSIFGAPGSTAPPTIEMLVPQVKQAKRPDGFYGFFLRGTLGRLEPMPAGGATGATTPSFVLPKTAAPTP
jgi:type II secretion system protein N